MATEIDAHTHILNTDVAVLVAPDLDSLARGLIMALSDPAAAKSRAARAQELYRTNYSRNIYVGKMRKLLDWIALDVQGRCASHPNDDEREFA